MAAISVSAVIKINMFEYNARARPRITYRATDALFYQVQSVHSSVNTVVMNAGVVSVCPRLIVRLYKSSSSSSSSFIYPKV